jgi:hypothetical protein
MNGWVYADANPANLTDRSGLCVDLDLDGKCESTTGLGFPAKPLPDVTRYYCPQEDTRGECLCSPTRVIHMLEGPQPQGMRLRYLGEFGVSGYYAPSELDPGYGWPNAMTVAIPRARHPGQWLKASSLSLFSYTDKPELAQDATARFLDDPTGVCYQGHGRLSGGLFVSCISTSVGFEWELHPERYVPYRTAAVCSSGPIQRGTRIYLPQLRSWLTGSGRAPEAGGWLEVTDTGGQLCVGSMRDKPAIDIYVGEGHTAYTKILGLTNEQYVGGFYNHVKVYAK